MFFTTKLQKSNQSICNLPSANTPWAEASIEQRIIEQRTIEISDECCNIIVSYNGIGTTTQPRIHAAGLYDHWAKDNRNFWWVLYPRPGMIQNLLNNLIFMGRYIPKHRFISEIPHNSIPKNLPSWIHYIVCLQLMLPKVHIRGAWQNCQHIRPTITSLPYIFHLCTPKESVSYRFFHRIAEWTGKIIAFNNQIPSL